MSSESPSSRWSHEHGGTGRQRREGYLGKRSFDSWWSAARFALKLNARSLWQRVPRRYKGWRWPYKCYWDTDFRDGEVGLLHWHVGRRKRHRE